MRWTLWILLGIFSGPLGACGYLILGDQYRIALLDPLLLGPDYAPFFYSAREFNTTLNAQAGKDRLRNAADWAEQLGGAVTPESVMKMLYETAFTDYVAVREGDRSNELAGNPAWRAVEQQPELLEYLMWAKAYEEPNRGEYDWWNQPEEDSVDERYHENMRGRAERGLAASVKKPWLHQRWTYQLFLLSKYAGDEAGMLAYFDKLSSNSILYDWARFHMAPFWNDAGRTELELARAFRVTPEKSLAAYQLAGRTFDLATALTAAENDVQRGDIYALAAVKRSGRALDLIRKAYQYNRDNPVLNLLLVREINKVEDWLLSHELTGYGPAVVTYPEPNYDYDNQTYEDYRREVERLRLANVPRDRAYLNELRNFLTRNDAPGTYTHYWELFRAQLALLAEDYAPAAALANGLRLSPDPKVRVAAEKVEFLALLQSGDLSAPRVRTRLVRYLSGLREKGKEAEFRYYAPPTAYTVLNKLAGQTFEAAGDSLSAYLFDLKATELPTVAYWRSDYYATIDYLDRPVSKSLIDRAIDFYARQEERSEFDRYLLLGDVPAAEMADRLRDLGGTLALRRNEPGVALAYFESVRTAYRKAPFTEYLREPAGHKVAYARRLTDLGRKSENGNVRATLDLAAAWYDMTYYGDNWMLLSYGWSSIVPEGPTPFPRGGAHAGIPHTRADYELIVNGSRARDLYKLAYERTNQPDLRAEAKFHLLNLERMKKRSRLLAGKYLPWEEEFALLDNLYRETFDDYGEEYGETEFYRGLLQQCGWFASRY